MILLGAQGIRKNYGDEAVLDGVTFDIRPGDRISLVGPNGSGKTTLMRIIAGQEDADAGDLEIHRSVHVGFLEQQPDFPADRTLWQQAELAMGDLITLQEESLSVAEEMSHAEDERQRARLAARYDHLQHELSRRDGYNIRHKIERVLCGLGFPTDAFNRPIGALSGGEQNRLMLAGLLLSEPNLMLLDEPSNHLDIEATEWLEDFLLDSSAAMLLVSHDRRFLDKVADRTLELLNGTVDDYTGNYTAYRKQKAERLLVQQRTYEKQQTEIAKTEDFIRRHNYGQKHAQAEDRRKKLARIERVELPRTIETPPMAFPPASRSGDIVLRADSLAKSFGDRKLFEDVSIQIERGERWGLIGPNGSGKTTLLRCLLGQVASDRGEVQIGTGVEIGYFDQQLAELADDTLAVDAIRPPRREMFEQQRRDLLARFGLTGDIAMRQVGVLSGGQRCRAALARLSAAEANFLVLDEPTNHLDLWARDGLEAALERFDGTVLFVSHDRYFVDRVADHLLVIEPDRIRVVEGGYQSYKLLKQREQEAEKLAAESAARAKSSAKSGGSKDEADKGTTKRKRRFPYRKLEDIETDIFAKEERLAELHEELTKGETYRDGNRAKQVAGEIETCREELAQLYEHWEEATELNW